MLSLVTWLNTIVEGLASYGIWGLVVVAFIEASFFPVPPDILLIPLALIDPLKALWYALLCTLASTAGGVFGQWIGLKAGRPLLEHFASQRHIHLVEKWFKRYGGLAVAFAALTPIPYKVFTIAAGVFKVGVRPVIWGSLLGRGLRFFFEAGMILLMGKHAVDYLARYSGPITFMAGVILVAWLVIRQRRPQAH
ncbi:MAG TPA: DedA family protein [Firmicutes bacterium]|nr:DedA family protein [Bacillota bacterium]